MLGMYAPAIAKEILDQNSLLQSSHGSKGGQAVVNLKGIAMGNGW